MILFCFQRALIASVQSRNSLIELLFWLRLEGVFLTVVSQQHVAVSVCHIKLFGLEFWFLRTMNLAILTAQ